VSSCAVKKKKTAGSRQEPYKLDMILLLEIYADIDHVEVCSDRLPVFKGNNAAFLVVRKLLLLCNRGRTSHFIPLPEHGREAVPHRQARPTPGASSSRHHLPH
jgi:hypothetical protein